MLREIYTREISYHFRKQNSKNLKMSRVWVFFELCTLTEHLKLKLRFKHWTVCHIA